MRGKILDAVLKAEDVGAPPVLLQQRQRGDDLVIRVAAIGKSFCGVDRTALGNTRLWTGLQRRDLSLEVAGAPVGPWSSLPVVYCAVLEQASKPGVSPRRSLRSLPPTAYTTYLALYPPPLLRAFISRDRYVGLCINMSFGIWAGKTAYYLALLWTGSMTSFFMVSGVGSAGQV